MVDIGNCKHCGKMVGTDNQANVMRWQESEIINYETVLVHRTCVQYVDKWSDHVKKKELKKAH